MKKLFTTLVFLLLIALASYGVSFGKTFIINPFLTVEVPEDTPDFSKWLGMRQQSVFSSNLGVVVVDAISPADPLFHYQVVVFAHLCPNGEVMEYVLVTIVEMKGGKVLSYLVDQAYLDGKPASRKLTRVNTQPNFEAAVKANDKLHSRRGRL